MLTSAKNGHSMSAQTNLKPSTQWLWLILFVVAVALLGGSSRTDQVQLIALRPISALFLMPILYYLSIDRLHQTRAPLLMLAVLVVWMVAQLVPLPPDLWATLPERDLLRDLDQLTSSEGLWRPISLAPSRGLDALFGMIVPVVALLLGIALRADPRMLLQILLGLAIVDALLGIVQVLSGGASPLYFYSITSLGSAVGVLANENHSGVFSAIAMLIAAHMALTSHSASEPSWLRLVYPPAFILFLVAALIGGSRTALAMSLLSLVASGVMIMTAIPAQNRRQKARRFHRLMKDQRWAVIAISFLILGALIGAFFFFGRAEGLEEVLSDDDIGGLRALLWPTLVQMIQHHWLWGSGFGSFEELYHLYEPTNLLIPQYVNEAHNDWAQFLIEGGLPAAALLLLLIGWLVYLLLRTKLEVPDSGQHVVFWSMTFLILAVGSAVDYPLRTPVFQLISVWLILALLLERNALLQRRATR